MHRRDTKNMGDCEALRLSMDDPSAFEEIVDRYQGAFLSKARSILGREHAEDAVQEAFVKMYLNAGKFSQREGAAFSSWSYKILLNCCYSHYKKHKREKGFVSFDETVFSEALDAGDETRMEKFLFVLSKLPAGAAKILRSLALEGKTYKDLSIDENVSEGAVRVRAHRAKSEFKKALAQFSNI